MNKIQKEDIYNFVKSFELANELRDCTILITGGTGLIASCLIHCLLALKKNIRIIAPVRNRAKAEAIFVEDIGPVEWIECDLITFNYSQIGKVDYIIHCAAPTSSRYFIENPVETIDIIYQGTARLLEYASRVAIKGFVYLSSLEVYGSEISEKVITENIQGYWDTMNVRSSYPIAKRATECLCAAYASEYNVPVKIARLTQVTGAGVSKDDNRVIVQFARLASFGGDIVLHTSGDSSRPYCYSTDCVSALLYILLLGKTGDVYNVANDETYISVREMAEYLRDNENPTIKVRIELTAGSEYAPVSKLDLSVDKLMALGWRPRYGLKEILERLIAYLKDEE